VVKRFDYVTIRLGNYLTLFCYIGLTRRQLFCATFSRILRTILPGDVRLLSLRAFSTSQRSSLSINSNLLFRINIIFIRLWRDSSMIVAACQAARNKF